MLVGSLRPSRRRVPRRLTATATTCLCPGRLDGETESHLQPGFALGDRHAQIDENRRMNSFNTSRINPVSGTPGVVTFTGLNGTPLNPYGYQWKNSRSAFRFAWKPPQFGENGHPGWIGIFFAHPFDAGVPLVNALGLQHWRSVSAPRIRMTRRSVSQRRSPNRLRRRFSTIRSARSRWARPQRPRRHTSIPPAKKTGYATAFNLGVQREVPAQIVVAATLLEQSVPQAPERRSPDQSDSAFGAGAVVQQQACRPYPEFNNVSIQSPTIGETNYYGTGAAPRKMLTRTA